MDSEVVLRQAGVLAEAAPRLRAVAGSRPLAGEEHEATRALLARLSRRCEIAAGDVRWALHSAPADRIRWEHASVSPPDDLPGAARDTAMLAGEVHTATEILGQAIGDGEVARGWYPDRWHRFRASMALAGMLTVALTNKDGLGLASGTGSSISRAISWTGILLGRESLAAKIAVASVLIRMEIAFAVHEELRTDPFMQKLFTAVREDRTTVAIASLLHAIKAKGGEKIMATLAPVFPEILALNGLQDENPFNDVAAWELVLGLKPLHDPILGIPLSWISKLDEGEGYAERVDLTTEVTELLADGGMVAWLRTVQHLGGAGQIIIQQFDDDHWLLILPGMGFGAPRMDNPQDLVGAFRNTNDVESPYTRAVRKAMDLSGIPAGVQLAIIGHSAGGAAAMNLAQNEEFSHTFRVTHVVAVGSPIDFKRAADSSTWVASVTNQHDIVPTLDDVGFCSPFVQDRDWFEVDYVDDTHEFPMCHSAAKYADNMATVVAAECAQIDEAVSAYRGKARRVDLYAIYDRHLEAAAQLR